MATGPGVNQGKTAFLEEFLPENHDADLKAVNQAWGAAGHDGTISESLYQKTRSRLRLAGKAASGGGAAKSSPRGAKAEKSPKAEGPPSQPQGKPAAGPNKTAFIREQLGRDGTLDARAINRAWSAAGHEGEVADNLVYKTRASMGIKGRRATTAGEGAVTAGSGRSPRQPEPAAPPAAGPPTQPSNGRHEPSPATGPTRSSPVAGGRGHQLHEIEGEIDELMFRLRGLGEFPEVLEALRTARRLLVRSHGD